MRLRGRSSSIRSLIVSSSEELQAQQPALALGVDDAADHVVAAGDLLVVGARAVDDAAGLEVDEVRHDRRGAHVDGEPHATLSEGARVDAQDARRQVGAVDPVAHLEGDVHLPVGHAKVAGEAAQQGQFGAHVLDAVLLGQGAPQAVEVARVVGERGRLDGDVDGAHGRVSTPVAAHRQGLGLGDGVAVRSHLLGAPRRHRDLDGPPTSDWQARAAPAATSAADRRPWSRRSTPSPATFTRQRPQRPARRRARRSPPGGRRRVEQRRAGRHLGHPAAGQEGTTTARAAAGGPGGVGGRRLQRERSRVRRSRRS